MIAAATTLHVSMGDPSPAGPTTDGLVGGVTEALGIAVPSHGGPPALLELLDQWPLSGARSSDITTLRDRLWGGWVTMDFETRVDDDHVIWLSGELDVAAVDHFSTTVAAALDGQRELVVDLSALTFLDS